MKRSGPFPGPGGSRSFFSPPAAKRPKGIKMPQGERCSLAGS